MPLLYELPQVSRGPKEWYIYYFFRHPLTGKMKRFKERFNINRIHDPKEKERYAQECVKFLTKELKAGFNPFEVVAVGIGKRSVLEQLRLAMEALAEGGSKVQRESYERVYRKFEEWLQPNGYANAQAHHFELPQCMEYQEWLKGKQLAGKTINGLISHLGLFWDHLISKGMAKENYWRKLPPAKRSRDENQIFDPITPAELKRITAHLRAQGQERFLVFLGFLYYAFARPIEVLRLRVEDVDMERRLISFKKGQTKNAKAAFVQIVPPFAELLQGLGLHKYAPGDYVFSTIDLLPGPAKRPDDAMWKLWHRLVQRDLGIDKQMYALKHTGNIDYLLNNKGRVDLKWQQMQNRHSSAAMTENYCRRLGAYFVETEHINMPKF